MYVFVSSKASVGEKMVFILKGQSYITPYLAFKGILLSEKSYIHREALPELPILSKIMKRRILKI